MSSPSDKDQATGVPASGDAYARLHRQQLLIIRKTSIPGVVLGGGGILLVLGAALFWADSAETRRNYLAIVACGAVLVGFWARSLWHCRRDDLYHAFLAGFAANVITTGLMILFIEDGGAMALVTAFTGLSAGASLLDARTLRNASAVTTAVVLLAGTAHHFAFVEAIAIPPFLLYAATISAIVAGFRTPIAALAMFNEHLKASRGEALRHARAAEAARRQADAQARKLLEVSEELRDFTYVVSHDLRAPLINIEGFASALGDTLSEFDAKLQAAAAESGASAAAARALWIDAHAEAVESMHFITRSTEKLNALVIGLLELSRIDSKPQQEKEVALAPLLEQIVASLQHQIRERDITVTVAPLPSVVADPLRVNQVFANLVDNAIKYMPERAPREIAVECATGESEYIFSVIDSGDGISAENRPKGFRPFKRLDPKGSAAGEGLGLAAVRKIVERQGGRIWIEDAPSRQGVSFRFSWPRKDAPAAPNAAAAELSAA